MAKKTTIKKKSKVIQFAVSSGEGADGLYVLLEDGSIWYSFGEHWTEFKLPEGK